MVVMMVMIMIMTVVMMMMMMMMMTMMMMTMTMTIIVFDGTAPGVFYCVHGARSLLRYMLGDTYPVV